jgi:hypothetical protein
LIAALALTGCASVEVEPSPTPTPVDTTTWIGGVIDPEGTTWTGIDSAGDATTFVLGDDGTVDVTFGANSFDEPGDRWSVTDGVLTMDIHLDATHGRILYSGSYDPAATTLTATGTTTVSAKSVTVTLTQG